MRPLTAAYQAASSDHQVKKESVISSGCLLTTVCSSRPTDM